MSVGILCRRWAKLRNAGVNELYSSRGEVLSKTIRVLIHRYMKRLAQRHVAAGDPRVAIYAFDIIGSAISLFGRFERDELDALSQFLETRRVATGICDSASSSSCSKRPKRLM